MWVLGVFFLLAGCARKKMDINDYQNYLANPQNGLTVQHEAGQAIKTELRLEPLEWQALKASFSERAVNEEAYRQYKEKNRGVLQFSFRVFLPEAMDLHTYLAGRYENPEEALLYAEYDLKDDFKLSVNGSRDSLTAALAHYQPSFGMKPYEEFIVLFHTDDPGVEQKKLDLVYHDYLFGLHDRSYAFSEETMNNIPTLNTN